MAKHLHVRAGIIVNVVDYLTAPPDVSHEGDDIVPASTGTENVGDAFNVLPILKQRRFDRHENCIFQELFRLTNAVRALQGSAALTVAQYRSFVLSNMT